MEPKIDFTALVQWGVAEALSGAGSVNGYIDKDGLLEHNLIEGVYTDPSEQYIRLTWPPSLEGRCVPETTFFRALQAIQKELERVEAAKKEAAAKERRNAYARQYYHSHKQPSNPRPKRQKTKDRRAYARQYYQEHKEQYKIRQRQHLLQHPGYRRQYQQARRAQIRHRNGAWLAEVLYETRDLRDSRAVIRWRQTQSTGEKKRLTPDGKRIPYNRRPLIAKRYVSPQKYYSKSVSPYGGSWIVTNKFMATTYHALAPYDTVAEPLYFPSRVLTEFKGFYYAVFIAPNPVKKQTYEAWYKEETGHERPQKLYGHASRWWAKVQVPPHEWSAVAFEDVWVVRDKKHQMTDKELQDVFKTLPLFPYKIRPGVETLHDGVFLTVDGITRVMGMTEEEYTAAKAKERKLAQEEDALVRTWADAAAEAEATERDPNVWNEAFEEAKRLSREEYNDKSRVHQEMAEGASGEGTSVQREVQGDA